MAKKNLGRSQINVLDSVPYSEIIFLIASGKNYALAIAEARGKTDSSPTAKQLNQLVERGFLKSQKEKLLNKTIFSINWERLTDLFVDFVFENLEKCYNYSPKDSRNLKDLAKKGVIKNNQVGETMLPKLNEYYKLIQDKKFGDKFKKNQYIKVLLRVIFDFSHNLKDRTIRQVFEELLICLADNRNENLFSRVHTTLTKEDCEKMKLSPSKEFPFGEITNKQREEFVQKTFEINEKDSEYKILLSFLEIIKYSLFNENGIQAIYHFEDYLQTKYSLMYFPENPITKTIINQSATMSFSKELDWVIEDNPQLKMVIEEILDKEYQKNIKFPITTGKSLGRPLKKSDNPTS